MMNFTAYVVVFLLGLSVAWLSDYLRPQKIRASFLHPMKDLRRVLEVFISNTTSKNTNELTVAEYEKSLIMDK
jgi:hypothetical protein